MNFLEDKIRKTPIFRVNLFIYSARIRNKITNIKKMYLYPKLILNSLGYSEGSIGYKTKEVNL